MASPLMPSGSAVERTMECPASHQLPQVHGTSEAAQRGTAIHAYLEQLVKGQSHEKALEVVPEQYRDDCLEVDMAPFWAQQYRDLQAEVSMAVNIHSGLARVVGSNRNYSTVTPEEFYGTADYIGRTVDGVLVVGDFKTGQANVSHPRNNWQLKTLAYILAQLHGENAVEAVIVKTDGETRLLIHRFDAMDLALIAEDLRILHAKLQKPQAPREGKHCDWCPAYKQCPAKVALLRELAAAPVLTAEALAGELKNGDAKAAYRRFRTIKTALQKVEAELRMLAEQSPIDLGDGWFYGQVKQSREELDGKVAFEAVMGLYGPEAAKEAVSFATSKTAIEKAIAPHCAKGTKAGAVRAIIDTVASNGGVTITEKSILKEYRHGEE